MYKNKKVGILLILPMLFMILTFLIYPFFKNIIDSFYVKETYNDLNPLFVGFKNYKTLFNTSHFKYALTNTFILMGLVLIFQVGLALLLALLVNSVSKLQTFYKVSYFLPIVISASALGLLFQMFYRHSPSEARQGALNQLLIFLNFKPIEWISGSSGSKLVYTAMSIPIIWQYIGFYFVIFLTALTTIPDELMDASSIDGANSIQKAIKVQIPLIQNVTRVVIVLAITGTLKVFDLPYIINVHAEPNRRNYFLGTFMNYLAYNKRDIGLSAAFAVILVILGVVLSMLSNTIFKQNKDL